MEETILMYNINNKLYTKDEILMCDELKKEYLNILKYENHKEKVKNTMRGLRQENPEKYKEAARIFMRNKYNNDLEYRARVLARARERNQKKAELENKTIRTGRGRPPKFKLDENLKCISIH